MADTKKIIAGAVAAAATAGLVAAAAKRMLGNDAGVYYVIPAEEGWAVKSENAKRVASRHETKKPAVAAGRELARANRPSRLVIHKQDGEIQRVHDYDVD